MDSPEVVQKDNKIVVKTKITTASKVDEDINIVEDDDVNEEAVNSVLNRLKESEDMDLDEF